MSCTAAPQYSVQMAGNTQGTLKIRKRKEDKPPLIPCSCPKTSEEPHRRYRGTADAYERVCEGKVLVLVHELAAVEHLTLDRRLRDRRERGRAECRAAERACAELDGNDTAAASCPWPRRCPSRTPSECGPGRAGETQKTWGPAKRSPAQREMLWPATA